MKRSLTTRWIALALSTLPLGGCNPGFLYANLTSPLTHNYDRTKVCTKSGESGTDEFSIPLNRGSITGGFDSRAVGDAAKNGGLTTVHYADQHYISILGGLWKRRTVIVYGE